MKSRLAFAIVAGTLWTANTAPAFAQGDPYRWCAEFAAGEGGSAANCYFITPAMRGDGFRYRWLLPRQSTLHRATDWL